MFLIIRFYVLLQFLWNVIQDAVQFYYLCILMKRGKGVISALHNLGGSSDALPRRGRG